jgi:hypothetical protein
VLAAVRHLRIAAIAIASSTACGGSVGGAPAPASWCADHSTVTLGDGLPGDSGGVRFIGQDATYIYWFAENSSRWGIRRTPKAGGATETLATVAQWGGGVALSDESVFYGAPATTPSGYGLFVIPKSGGAPTLVADARAGALAVNATTIVYFDAITGVLMSVPKTGGTPAMVWTPPTRTTYLATLDDANAYVLDEPNVPPCALYRVPLQSGAPATRVFEGGYIRAVALREQSLYITSYDPNGLVVDITTMPSSGGATTTLASTATTAMGIQGTLLAFDATNLYTDDDQGGIVSLPLAGGTLTTTAARGGAQGIHALAVDDAAMYWGADAETGGGSLMRLCK